MIDSTTDTVVQKGIVVPVIHWHKGNGSTTDTGRKGYISTNETTQRGMVIPLIPLTYPFVPVYQRGMSVTPIYRHKGVW